VQQVLKAGYRTGDIMDQGGTLVGCNTMGNLVNERI
jgi:3-isopropylmalate dehydrogenase